jgi:hypothetical protein
MYSPVFLRKFLGNLLADKGMFDPIISILNGSIGRAIEIKEFFPGSGAQSLSMGEGKTGQIFLKILFWAKRHI